MPILYIWHLSEPFGARTIKGLILRSICTSILLRANLRMGGVLRDCKCMSFRCTVRFISYTAGMRAGNRRAQGQV